MSLVQQFERYYLQIKSNRWYWLFSIFCRITLAYAFIVAGLVKVMDERFASGLSTLHPMGAYLEALHHTGYYYAFIGYAQIAAAILLLIPRTVVLGAMFYFPIILNIWLLSYSVRFEGSYVTSPLMLLANSYLLVWHYDKLRFLLPFRKFSKMGIIKKPEKYSNRFPILFFGLVVLMSGAIIANALFGQNLMPRNSLKDCRQQFENKSTEAAGFAFCSCIHQEGKTLDECEKIYQDLQKQ